MSSLSAESDNLKPVVPMDPLFTDIDDNPALTAASTRLALCLASKMVSSRPSRRGRKSLYAGDLYVKGAAQELGITVTHMSRLLTGKQRPGMELATRIAEFAECSIEEILAVSRARVARNAIPGDNSREVPSNEITG